MENTILIVGGDSEIGLSIASDFRTKSREVITTTRRRTELQSNSLFLDIETGEGLTDLAKKLQGKHLTTINVTGILGQIGPLSVMEKDKWQRVFDTNFFGVAELLKTFLPVIGAGSRFIFLTGGGIGGPNPQHRVFPYVISKGSLALLLELAARDEVSNKFPLVGLAPGAFPTKFVSEIYDYPDLSGEKLMDDTIKNSTNSMDVSKIVSWIEAIETELGQLLSGRIISANRDNPNEVREFLLKNINSSFGKLRRIDSSLYRENF